MQIRTVLVSLILASLSISALAECALCQCVRRQPGQNRMEEVVMTERRVDTEAKCVQGCADLFGGYFGGANGYRYTPLDEKQCQDCGRHWTGWREIGAAVGSPCPRGCDRAEEVGQDYRLVGLFPRPQHKHKFQCYGEPAPAPAQSAPDQQVPIKPLKRLPSPLERRTPT